MSRGQHNEQDHSCYYEVFMPSEEEVWSRAAAIRAGWSDQERDKRAGHAHRAPVELTPVHVSVETRKRLSA